MSVEIHPEPQPGTVPAPPNDKRDASVRVTLIGRLVRSHVLVGLDYDKQITRMHERIAGLTAKKEARQREILEEAKTPAQEVLLFAKLCWDVLTRHGSVKLIRFRSGELEFRDLPDRAVVPRDRLPLYFKEVRQRRKAKSLIRRGKDEPNLTELGKNLELAGRMKSVVIERRSVIRFRPFSTDHTLEVVVPRKMADGVKSLIGSGTFDWSVLPPRQ